MRRFSRITLQATAHKGVISTTLGMERERSVSIACIVLMMVMMSMLSKHLKVATSSCGQDGELANFYSIITRYYHTQTSPYLRIILAGASERSWVVKLISRNPSLDC
jgi:hypothetical protein